jgi:hypothetical protein
MFPRRNTVVILGLLVSLFSLPVQTQVVIPTNYELNIYLRGATSRMTFFAFQHSGVTCNLTTTPGIPGSLNPRYLIWDDENNVNRFCVYDTGNGTGPLFALPVADYEAGLVAFVTTPTATVASPESAHANFSRLAQPAVRTGFRVTGVQ